MQIILGSLMLWMSFSVQTLLDNVRVFGLICIEIIIRGLATTADLFAWGRSQAIDHIYMLTVIFTSLVVIAATQGNVIRRGTLSARQSDLPYFIDIAVDGKPSPCSSICSVLK
jgi:hypothetical protein